MKTRNDLDLDKFERMLKEKLARLESNIDQIKSELDAVGSDDSAGDLEDFASLTSLNERDNTLLSRQEEEIKEIKHALGKIRNGTYGICEKTGKPIPVARLEANPIARYVVGAEEPN